jgi:hypothetical protein
MNLVDVIKQQLMGEVGKKIGSMTGIGDADLQKTVGAALPGLLSGLGAVASTKQGAGKIADAIGGLDSSLFGNLAGMLGSGAMQKGGGMLSNLMGSTVIDGLASAISKATGISQSMIKTALGFMTPMILGAVGASFKGGKIDASGITKLFDEQKQNISASLPPGLNLDSIPGFRSLSSAGSAVASAASQAPAAAASGLSKLLVPGLLLAAILAGVFFLMNRAPEAAKKVSDAASSAATKGVDAASDALSNAIPKVNFDSVKGDFTGLMDGLGLDLGKITDVASADAAMPSLKDAIGKLETMSGVVNQLPAESKSMFGDLAKGQLDKLNPMIEKISAIPGLGDAVKALLEQLKALITKFLP